jgi:hypothetical protein
VARHAEPVQARRAAGGLVVAAVIVGALYALLVWSLTRLLPTSPSAAAIVQQWCGDLRSGNVNEAYSRFSVPYQHSTSLAVFESRLLGSGHSASCASTAPQADRASLSLRQANGQTRTVDLNLRDQAGQWRITAMRVSP